MNRPIPDGSLQLAFLGDAIYSCLTREYILANQRGKIGALHKEANKIVNANAQAAVFDALFQILTDEEKEVAKRARNVHSGNVPKSSSLENYKKSTSLEAVFGFNAKNEARNRQLFAATIENYEKHNKEK